MILGIGTDIVEVERIHNSLDKIGNRFMERILTKSEQECFHKLTNKDRAAAYLAKRFAAKEAAVKALGTGIAKGVSFQDFCVSNDALGKPVLEVTSNISDMLSVAARWHISLTDERQYAQAFVIIESAD